MVVILNNADFSENNIGTITIRELDAFTKAAISASGNTSMTDTQKYALNDLFESLGAFGTKSSIWSKLRYVFLPAIASDLSKAVLNYKDNTVTTTPSATYWQLRNNGIVGVSETNSNNLSFTDSEGFSGNNLSFIGATMEDLPSSTSIFFYLFGIGSSNPGRIAPRFFRNGNNQECGNCFYGGGNTTFSKSLKNKIYGASMTDDAVYYGYSGEISTSSSNPVASSISSVTSVRLFSSWATSNGSGNASISMLMLGTYLTSDELETLAAAVETFKTDYFA